MAPSQVARSYRETGLVPMDIEVIWIQPGDPDPNHQRLIDAGAEIGAKDAE